MKKNLLSLAMAIIMMFSIYPSAFAVEAETAKSGQVTFTGIDQLAPYETISYTITESNGSETIVGIEAIPAVSRADERSIRVWYEGIGISVEFYMTVSDNKVTSVSDYAIFLALRSYDDPVLTHTSTYGKLTFTLKSIAGVVTKTCWLRGSVTSKDNDITVDWDM